LPHSNFEEEKEKQEEQEQEHERRRKQEGLTINFEYLEDRHGRRQINVERVRDSIAIHFIGRFSLCNGSY
jgi:hypothetical protein